MIPCITLFGVRCLLNGKHVINHFKKLRTAVVDIISAPIKEYCVVANLSVLILQPNRLEYIRPN